MLYKREIQLPKRTFMLLGPRGTGKSTWVRQALPSALRIDFLIERTYQEALANPEYLARALSKSRPRDWIIIDEFQRLPSLLNEVHRQIEEYRLNFALTGSSARKLKRAGTNLLGGRASLLRMYSLTPTEMGNDFSLEQALRFGTLPIVLGESDPEEVLRSYTELYLKEEVQAEALVRNLAGFARFLPIAALMHAQTLEVSNIARDAGVSRTTVQGYLEILEDTLMVRKLPAFEGKLRVKERKAPKLYWFDPGVVRALKKAKGDVGQEEKGPLFEGVIHALLLQAQERNAIADQISYWSPHASNVEVDFVLEQGKDLVLIEVKSNSKIHSEYFKSLRAFDDPRVKRRILVHCGTDSFIDGRSTMPVTAMGFREFAEQIHHL